VVLYVLRVWQLFSILHSQMDASWSAHLDYSKGALPAGGKLVGTLLARDPLKHQIIHQELTASHEVLVVAPANSVHFYSRLPSSLIDKVYIFTLELLLHGFIVCLDMEGAHGDLWGGGRPQPMHHEERRLSYDSTGDVRLPHNEHGSSSIHFLPCFFKPS
jgi:hypothetical protein